MPYLPAGDGALSYSEEGTSGPPVLLIHGWGCDGSDWAWLAADLAADHRCVLLENRGHGRSSTRPSGYSTRELAADAAQVVQDLGLGPVIVVGHSLGGVIATTLAITRPELVHALVAIDPAYGVEDAAWAPLLDAVRAAPHAFATAAFSAFYGKLTPGWLPVWHRRRLLGTPGDVLAETLVGMVDGDDGYGRKTVSDRSFRNRVTPRLGVYSGANAGTAEWDRGFELTPLDRVLVWPEHGHFLHQEAPDRFAAELREWLTAVGPLGG